MTTNDALKTIEIMMQVRSFSEMEKDAFEQIMTANKWISVGDRLPEIGDEVLVLTEFKDIRIYSYMRIDQETADVVWEDDYGHWEEIASVTHWMPLPEPPKEGDFE